MAKEELKAGYLVGNYACIDCPSSDAMSVYKHDDDTYDAFCRSHCSVTGEFKPYKSNNRLAKSYLGDELGIKPVKRKVKARRSSSSSETQKEEVKPVSRVKRKEKKPITDEQREGVLMTFSLNYCSLNTNYCSLCT